ncbi:hypothetical protein ANN_11738 [Periplaneta americana]|uniref:Uncharacterized protein n=1 Tax=Periplaneta americana TaxID=6978 RepID=A0ABQ8T6J3_PERAM|nr:hypothetical protein ANN_11738 [Periplaneta americana]
MAGLCEGGNEPPGSLKVKEEEEEKEKERKQQDDGTKNVGIMSLLDLCPDMPLFAIPRQRCKVREYLWLMGTDLNAPKTKFVHDDDDDDDDDDYEDGCAGSSRKGGSDGGGGDDPAVELLEGFIPGRTRVRTPQCILHALQLHRLFTH